MQYAKPVTLNVEECDRLSFLPYLFGNDFLYSAQWRRKAKHLHTSVICWAIHPATFSEC